MTLDGYIFTVPERDAMLRLTSKWTKEATRLSGVAWRWHIVSGMPMTTTPDAVCRSLDAKPILYNPPPEAISCGSRIGSARRFAVDHFMARSDSVAMLMLDDDILLGPQTLRELVEDCRTLASYAHQLRFGGVTLHATCSRVVASEAIVVTNDQRHFHPLAYSGEGHVLFSREALKRVGNHFGTYPGGYGDRQFEALARAGFPYLTRRSPSYSVQHLGFGDDGSVIQDKGCGFSWVNRPYRAPAGDAVIQVPGFDIDYYASVVQSVGGKNAPERYLKAKPMKEI